MRRTSILIAIFLSLVVSPAAARERTRRLAPVPTAEAFVPGDVVVKLRPGAISKAEPLADFGLVRQERIARLGIERYRLAGGGDVLETVRRLRQRPDVEVAEPNYVVRLAMVPNDTFYSNYNGHARDLQRWTYGGVDGNAGIDAETAWDTTTGREDVTIAVIDSGVSLTHEDLAANIWTNPGEVPGNGRDDDANGFVDDVHGWDFYSGDNDPNPDLGDGVDNDGAGIGDDNVFHGTFVANMADGRGNDGHGVLGAAWNCKIMPIKVFTDDGVASTFHIGAALTYAADNGADVVNVSIETRTDSTPINEGAGYALAHDCVVVAAAGNGGIATPVSPASYSGVLSVGASGHAFENPEEIQAFGPARFDGRPSFTNFGVQAVDVVAPGIVFSSSVASKTDTEIDPTLHPGDAIGLAAEGTSFASPIVAGLAALVVSRDKDLHGGVRTLTNSEIVDIIQSTAVDLPNDLNDSPDGGANWDNHGRVNFPAAIAAVPGGTGRVVRLAWQAPSGNLEAPRELTADDSASRAAKLSDGVAEHEPDNTFAAAQPVSVPTTVSGTIQDSDDGAVEIVYESGPSDKVEDLYKLTLAEDTTLSITLTPAGASDLDLAVFSDFDDDGHYEVDVDRGLYSLNPVDQTRVEAITNATVPAGTYYIAVSVYDAAPGASSDTYTLALAPAGGPGVTGYRVYRATSPGVATTPANRVAEIGAATLSYVDASPPSGSVYYVVTAVFASGESAASNEASPDAPDPNAPAILGPSYKKGKLVMTAEGSKIVAGSMLVVDDTETFALKASADGSKWLVKKNTRSVPGNVRISQALVSGRDARLYVVTPTGLRSQVVTFRRP